MAIDIDREYISVKEAAKECAKNPETIRRWIWSGKLPSQKLGNQLFIKRSDLSHLQFGSRDTKKDEEWVIRAKALRNRMKARGVKPINSAKLIQEIREERMREIG